MCISVDNPKICEMTAVDWSPKEKRGEPVGVKTPLVWTIVGHVSETANEGNIANHVYTFHTTFNPE